MVVEGARRHHNYSVIRRQGTGLFIKQMQPDQAFSAQTLQKEAACYVMMESDPALAEIHALMPRFRAYDPERHLLVVELIDGGENLSELHRRLNGFPEDVAQRVGELLARYHMASMRDLLRSEEHTSELQSRQYLVCRLLLEKKNCEPLSAWASVSVLLQTTRTGVKPTRTASEPS